MSTIIIFIMSMFLCANAKSKTPEALLQALDQNYDSIKDDLLADLKKYLNQQDEKVKDLQAEVKALVEDYDSIEKRVNAESNKVDAISKAVKEVPECETRVDNLKKDDEQLEVDAKKALDCCHAKFSTTKKPTTTTTPSGKICWHDFDDGNICAPSFFKNSKKLKLLMDNYDLVASSLNLNTSDNSLVGLLAGQIWMRVCITNLAEYYKDGNLDSTLSFQGWKNGVVGGIQVYGDATKSKACPNGRTLEVSNKCGQKDAGLIMDPFTEPNDCFYLAKMVYPCKC